MSQSSRLPILGGVWSVQFSERLAVGLSETMPNVKNKGLSVELRLVALGYKECAMEVHLAIENPELSVRVNYSSLKVTEMQFNGSFSEDDSCNLVAFGLGLNVYHCGWITNGQSCNAPVLGQDVPTHLKTVHRVNETPRVVCLWGDCGEGLSKACLVRHVQERHLEYRWPCPRCGAMFTRRGVMDAHRATCHGTTG